MMMLMLLLLFVNIIIIFVNVFYYCFLCKKSIITRPCRFVGDVYLIHC